MDSPQVPAVPANNQKPHGRWRDRLRQWATRIDIIALVTAIASLSLAMVVELQNIYAERLAAANTFFTLRERYYRIDDQLHSLPASPPQKGSPDWLIVRRYWYQVFDEWYVIKRIESRDSLWNEFYEDVIDGALEKPTLGPVFCDLRKTELERGLRKEFADELTALHRRRHPGKELCT